MPKGPPPNSPPSTGTRNIRMEKFLWTTRCSRRRCQGSWMPGIFFCPAGEPRVLPRSWHRPSTWLNAATRCPKLMRHMGSEQLLKYPSSARVYAPGGKRWKEGEVFKNADFARTLRRLAEAEKNAKSREAGLKMARDRFYKGDIAREMALFSEQNGGLLRFEDF